jgi:hypothetical protein
MTTLSRQYKLSKNILFYILQRQGSEPGKMAANFRRGSESGGGGHAFEYDKQTKFILLQNIFCYAKYSAFSQLLPKTGGGVKCPDCYAPVL